MAEQHDETTAKTDPEKKESEAPESAESQTVASDESDESEEDSSDDEEARADSSEASESEDEEDDEEEPAPVVAAPTKKKKKKRALQEEAALQPSRDRNKRLREEAAGIRPKRGTKAAPARGLEAGEMVDDALARSSQAMGDWLKKNFAIVQWLVIALIVGWVAYAVYNYRAGKQAAEASGKLTSAIRAEAARIGADETKPDPQTGIVDTRAAFATDEARLKAAEAQYRAIADGGASNAATFARLGLASVLYDQSKFADAKAAYQLAKDSKLASQDASVKGRAIEGLGMSQEALADKDGANKSFGELANIDAFGFNALGAYHQARLAFAAGDTAKAKELLQTAQKRLDGASGDAKKVGAPPNYLQQSVRDLMRRVDPSAAAPSSGGALTAEQIQELSEQMSGGDGKGMSQEKLQELLKRMAKTAPAPGSTPAPPASGQ